MRIDPYSILEKKLIRLDMPLFVMVTTIITIFISIGDGMDPMMIFILCLVMIIQTNKVQFSAFNLLDSMVAMPPPISRLH